MTKKISVKISQEIFNKIQQLINLNKVEFQTVEGFIEFVLMELLNEDDSEGTYTAEEEEMIKRRLRDLGYIS